MEFVLDHDCPAVKHLFVHVNPDAEIKARITRIDDNNGGVGCHIYINGEFKVRYWFYDSPPIDGVAREISQNLKFKVNKKNNYY